MLSRVPDFRDPRGREYSLSFILAVCVVGVLAGAKNIREIASVAANIPQEVLTRLGSVWDWFARRYRYPRKSAIWYALSHIDPAELDRIIGNWIMRQARKSLKGDGKFTWEIAMDGKVMRGSWTSENDQVTLFSAMLQKKGLTIAQVRVPDGTNEITQVRSLARDLGIAEGESTIVTLDAAHGNKDTAEFIAGKPGWDYLVTVKTDKPSLYSAAARVIAREFSREPDDIMTERGRGVFKVWSCWVADAGGIDFPGISQVGYILREVFSLSGEKISKDAAIEVTSAPLDMMSAAGMNRLTREHWGIENKGHHIRDTTFREDHNQTWAGSGPQAIASLNNLAISLFNLKGVKCIKEASEQVHMDRTRALKYMTT